MSPGLSHLLITAHSLYMMLQLELCFHLPGLSVAPLRLGTVSVPCVDRDEEASKESSLLKESPLTLDKHFFYTTVLHEAALRSADLQ